MTIRHITLLFIAASLSCAQTITLSSSDSRCGGSPLTCTFVAPEGMPNDYGVALNATVIGGGTWIIGAENQSTCSSQLFAWYRQGTPPTAPPAISSIGANGTVFIAPVTGVAGTCAPGTYTHTITLTNGTHTYTFTGVQKVFYRLAAPVFLNGCGITDASLSGAAQGNCAGGMTQQAPASYSVSYDLNKVPCADCRPGGTFNMPAPGGTFFDQFGNVHTVITPVGFVAASDAEKSELSLNNTWIVVTTDGSPAYSGWYIFPSTGSSTPSYQILQSDIGNGVWAWSNTSDNDIYGFVDPGFNTGADTPFKHVTLGVAAPSCTTGCYTKVTGPGVAAGSIYILPYATYGRAYVTGFSHQDMNKLGWFALNTVVDYNGQVNTNGTAMTWRTGQQPFENIYSVQSPITINGSVYIVTSCADNHNCTLQTSAGVQTNVLAYGTFNKKLCAFNVQQMDAQGSAYTPICGDFSTSPSPKAYYINGVAYLSHDVDGAGNLYIAFGSNPRGIVGSFNPSSSSVITLQEGWNQAAQGNGSVLGSACTAADSVLGYPGSSYCYGTPHASGFSTSDGKQWIGMGGNSTHLDTFLFNSIGNTIVPYEANGYTGNFLGKLDTQYVGGEYSGARKSPYLANSTGVPFVVPSYTVANCTNTSPTVLTLSQTPNDLAAWPTPFNTTTRKKILVGGVQGNTACNGSQVIASVSGTNNEILTLSVNGNGAYTGSTGNATEDVSFSHLGDGDADQIYVCRELCQEVRRIGHTRSLYYNDRVLSSYYAVTRASLSMDASKIVYTTNAGIPGQLQVVMATTGIGNAIGRTTNMFDQTHSVTSIGVTATTASLHYSTPDIGNAIVEIGQTQRFVDVPGIGTSADSTYQKATDSSGTNPRTTTFSGLTVGIPYYYRIVANNKAMAWGTFTPAAVNSNGDAVLQNVVVKSAVIR